jgi:DNA-binding GntR family transcriptional regulator
MDADIAARTGDRTSVVADRLRDLIVHGQIAPGARIVERTLCRVLDVSRTPLREALKLLARDGLVELVPHCGARVTPVTAEGARHLFDVLGVLESLAAEEAAATLSPERLDRLEGLHAAMLAHYRAEAREPYFAVNTEIHDLVVAWSSNAVLRETHARLMLQARRGRFSAIVDAARWAEAVAEHEALMAALRARDPAAAAAVWRRHLVNTGKAVVLAIGRVDASR